MGPSDTANLVSSPIFHDGRHCLDDLWDRDSGNSSCPDIQEARFLDVSQKVLPKLHPSIAKYIEAAVWKSQGDIRDVISIGKLVRKSDGPREIEQIMNTMAKYDNMMMQ